MWIAAERICMNVDVKRASQKKKQVQLTVTEAVGWLVYGIVLYGGTPEATRREAHPDVDRLSEPDRPVERDGLLAAQRRGLRGGLRVLQGEGATGTRPGRRPSSISTPTTGQPNA